METPKCAQNSPYANFCENDEEYNLTISKRFDDLMKNSPLSRTVTDLMNEVVIDLPEFDEGISLRTKEDDETPVCRSEKRRFEPRRARNVGSEWLYVLNQEETKQGIVAEICIDEKAECQFGGGGLPRTRCEQKHVIRNMLTLDEDGHEITSEAFVFPSCCMCWVVE